MEHPVLLWMHLLAFRRPVHIGKGKFRSLITHAWRNLKRHAAGKEDRTLHKNNALRHKGPEMRVLSPLFRLKKLPLELVALSI